MGDYRMMDTPVEAQSSSPASKQVGQNLSKTKASRQISDATRKRKEPVKPTTAGRVIPRCRDECSEEDKKLLDLRDAGMGWAELREVWEEMTGDTVATSTLPNRYARLKANFISVEPEDRGRLLEAKREIEQQFEKEKWALISARVIAKGGEEYKAVDLRRSYRRLMVEEAKIRPPVGVVDPDFGVEDEEEE